MESLQKLSNKKEAVHIGAASFGLMILNACRE